MTEGELRVLTRTRGGVKRKVTNFREYINSLKDKNIDVTSIQCELNLRLTNYESILKEFEAVQVQIENAVDEQELTKQFEERDKFTNEYYSILAQAHSLIVKDNVSSEMSDHNHDDYVSNSIGLNLNSNQRDSLGIKLPTIKLPKFSGNYDSWLEYKDTYHSLIHLNNSINNIQKFHYLKASLEETAAEAIQSIDFSASNYELAWQMLCSRFDNKKLLVNNHVKAIFDLPVIQKEISSQFRTIVDNVTKHLRSLKSIGQPTDKWDTLIIYILYSKFDKATAKEWEEFKVNNTDIQGLPELNDMIKFLNSKADLLETLEGRQEARSKETYDKSQRYQKHSNVHNLVAYTKFDAKCKLCEGNHYLYNCNEFIKLPVSARFEKIKDLNLCTNCLNSGHTNYACTRGNCKRCNKKHNTLLHTDQTNSYNTNQTKTQNEQQPAVKAVTNQSTYKNKEILLAIAYVYIVTSHGEKVRVKCLLDSGSQCSFVSEKLVRTLGLKTKNTNISITGFNGSISGLNKCCFAQQQSINSNYSNTVLCYVSQIITDNLPSDTISLIPWNIPKNIQLADHDFHKPSTVDMLLGANIFWELLLNGQIKLGKSLPILHNTQLGWIISGPIGNQTNHIRCNFVKCSDIQEQLTKFWELENHSNTPIKTNDDQTCESHFQTTTTRDSNGRFIVKMPFKQSHEILGNSSLSAESRFYALERKFDKYPDFKKKYVEFINEYISLGHMSKIDQSNIKSFIYFLPHHGVIRECSLTTKLRVVFDGSAKTTTGYSLNDIQYVGPTIQQDSFSILLRFRQHAFVITADIAKMYRQILISDKQRSLQQIYWRDDTNKDLTTYQLNTVTYGTASAPFLAVRSLMQLSLDFKETYPETSQIISRDFYVDDLLTGSDTKDGAVRIYKEISEILSSGCFELRKWMSNNPEILQTIKDTNTSVSSLLLGSNEKTKTLGLQWNCGKDILLYQINQNIRSQSITKRIILSEIAQIYDPLGLLSPCTIIAKIMIQKLWSAKLAWDENIPAELQKKWLTFTRQIQSLNTLEIPRHVMCISPKQIEIHGFCDSSQNAYGSCIYVRSINNSGHVQTSLLCAKTRVAPLNCVSIPRLELCGALVLAQLMDKVKNSLILTNAQYHTYYWTDSQVVLSWLKMQANLLQPFVGNRVAQIQNLCNINQWNYVGTKENPADILSRGMTPNTIHNSQLWWNGPTWLLQARDEWPNHNNYKLTVEIPELKRNVQVLSCTKQEFNIFSRYSSFTRLQRVVAYCIRFISNCRVKRESRNIDHLTVSELNHSTKALVRLAQIECFKQEIANLENNKQLANNSKLLSLTPFLDEENLLRVGGRLKNSNFTFDKRHPLLLSGSHILTKLIMSYEHKRLLHAGPQLLLASTRNKFWPINGKNAAKKIIRECITCFRVKPKQNYPIMGELPNYRVEPHYPFFATGIDYAGPMLIRDRKGRGFKLIKCYICVFICFATKAIHLEPISELTAEAFIAMLRRFTSRRGNRRHIFTDNGTYFVRANSDIKELYNFLKSEKSCITESCANENITWHFIPPHSPHFGGLWEADVKSCKYHLKRVIGNSTVTFENLLTLITQIEGILNSRPLCPLSSDPNDYEPITPFHFLIGRSPSSVPDPDVRHIKENRLSSLQHIQSMRQHFWHRWSREYITELQQRQKWTTSQQNIKSGTLVVLHDENAPPLKWKLGRICEVHSGKDNIVRVVSIKTNSGIYKRALSKISPLPMYDN